MCPHPPWTVCGHHGRCGCGARVWSGAEAVAHAGLGDQVPGVRGVALELVAQLGEVDAQVAGLLALRGPPDVGEELVAADEPAPVPDEQLEDAPLGGGE